MTRIILIAVVMWGSFLVAKKLKASIKKKYEAYLNNEDNYFINHVMDSKIMQEEYIKAAKQNYENDILTKMEKQFSEIRKFTL